MVNPQQHLEAVVNGYILGTLIGLLLAPFVIYIVGTFMEWVFERDCYKLYTHTRRYDHSPTLKDILVNQKNYLMELMRNLW